MEQLTAIIQNGLWEIGKMLIAIEIIGGILLLIGHSIKSLFRWLGELTR